MYIESALVCVRGGNMNLRTDIRLSERFIRIRVQIQMQKRQKHHLKEMLVRLCYMNCKASGSPQAHRTVCTLNHQCAGGHQSINQSISQGIISVYNEANTGTSKQ